MGVSLFIVNMIIRGVQALSQVFLLPFGSFLKKAIALGYLQHGDSYFYSLLGVSATGTATAATGCTAVATQFLLPFGSFPFTSTTTLYEVGLELFLLPFGSFPTSLSSTATHRSSSRP